MKTIIFALLFITTTSIAQKVSFAPAAGVGLSSIAFSEKTRDDYFRVFNSTYDGGGELTYFNPRITPSVGILVNYNTSGKLWSFRSGLNLSLRGGRLKSSGTVQGYPVNISLTHQFTYLELPLQAVYEFRQSGIRLIAGPTIGFALNGKGSLAQTVNGQSNNEEAKLDVGSDKFNDEIKPIDLGVSLGIAKVVPVANRPLEVSLTVQPSISKYNPSSKVANDKFGRHVTAAIRAAYFFALD